jgi:hypothetical protein
MTCYPANLCPLGLDVLNEVRLLADDSLSHDKLLDARLTSEGRQCCIIRRARLQSMTNFDRKKNDCGLDMIGCYHT